MQTINLWCFAERGPTRCDLKMPTGRRREIEFRKKMSVARVLAGSDVIPTRQYFGDDAVAAGAAGRETQERVRMNNLCDPFRNTQESPLPNVFG